MDEKFDWKEYLSQFDVVYESPSRTWQDGMPLGNGSLGAMAFESEAFYPEWTVNKNDVWDYRHPKFKRHSMERVRQIVEKDQNYHDEMAKENVPGTGMGKLPGPKTCGQLRLRFGQEQNFGPGHKITKRLGLVDATLHTSLDKHLSHPRIESFISANSNVLVVKVRDVSAMSAFHNKVDLFRVPDALMLPTKAYAKGDTIWLEQPFHDGMRFVIMARIVAKGGGKYRDLFCKTVEKQWWHVIEPSKKVNSTVEGGFATASVAGDFDIFLTVVTSLEAKEPLEKARQQLTFAVNKGSGKLHSEHRRWWSKFWPKSYIKLDDKFLEQLWYVSKYNLASTLRGVPVGGLCSLWYGPTPMPSHILPWGGWYTNDYNAQLPIMPTFRTNHPELAEGAFRTLLKQLPQAKRNAKELYDLPGAYYPLTADPTGEEISGGGYRFCQGSGPYWGVFLWWHYLYTQDKEFLKTVSYPIMREVSEFFVNYMTWHEDEKLYHLEISQNPELMYIKYPDPIDTLVMLNYTLSATIKAAEILGQDKKLVKKCQHVLDHYPPYPRHEKGFLPLKGLRPDHIKHARTLAGVFPTGLFDPELDSKWYKLCKYEIENYELWYRGYGCNKGHISGSTGFVYHAGLPACRIGLKDAAWKNLEDLLKTNLKPSGLITHNPAILADSRFSEKNLDNIPEEKIYHDLGPTPIKLCEIAAGRLIEECTENLEAKETMQPAFEGPAVYLLLLSEMLLQSHNGILRLFASLPDGRDAEFTDFRAEGPTLVSSARVKGKVRFIRVKAIKAVYWKLINPWPGKKTAWVRSSSSKKAGKIAADRYIKLNLSANEEVILAATEKDLNYTDSVSVQKRQDAQARSIVFEDGMMAWLGKPKQSVYYSALEKARSGSKKI